MVNQFQIPASRAFMIPRTVISSPGALIRQKRNRFRADPTKPNLDSLPNEILHTVFNLLPTASRISLGLTNKFFASLSQLVDTTLTSQPILHHHRKEDEIEYLPKTYGDRPMSFVAPIDVKFISTRRIFLLEIVDWMPSQYRLCLVCCKFTLLEGSAWYTKRGGKASRFHTVGHRETSQRKTISVHCHATCQLSKGNFMVFINSLCGKDHIDEALCRFCKAGQKPEATTVAAGYRPA